MRSAVVSVVLASLVLWTMVLVAGGDSPTQLATADHQRGATTAHQRGVLTRDPSYAIDVKKGPFLNNPPGG